MEALMTKPVNPQKLDGHAISGHDVPKISLRNLSVTYPSGDGTPVKVVQDVSLDVSPGQFVSIVGPSGCGKSTLLRVLSGLLEPASGTALVDGNPVTHAKDRVGFMFQRDTLLPWASAE